MSEFNKRSFRKEALKRRSQFSGADRQRAGEQLADQLIALDVFRHARTIAAYVPFGGEINVFPALEAVLDCEDCAVERIAMPRVIEKDHRLALHLCELDLFKDSRMRGVFVEGYGGILEPPATWPEISFDEFDVALIPGVAFDRQCMRIGYGKGFYDRMLGERRDDARAIGVIFDELLFDALPLEDHDVAMDIVVTPHEVLYAS